MLLQRIHRIKEMIKDTIQFAPQASVPPRVQLMPQPLGLRLEPGKAKGLGLADGAIHLEREIRGRVHFVIRFGILLQGPPAVPLRNQLGQRSYGRTRQMCGDTGGAVEYVTQPLNDGVNATFMVGPIVLPVDADPVVFGDSLANKIRLGQQARGRDSRCRADPTLKAVVCFAQCLRLCIVLVQQAERRHGALIFRNHVRQRVVARRLIGEPGVKMLMEARQTLGAQLSGSHRQARCTAG